MNLTAWELRCISSMGNNPILHFLHALEMNHSPPELIETHNYLKAMYNKPKGSINL